MIRFYRNGVWIKIIPDNDAVKNLELSQINIDEYEPTIHQALLSLGKLKAYTPDPDIKRYEDPSRGFTVTSAFDEDEITIVAKSKERAGAEEEKYKQVEGKIYVLLVEMGYGPDAFAIFEPDGDGYGAGTSGGANLKLTGWTDKKLDESKDPPGPVGQTTFRQRWCYDHIPVSIESPAGWTIEQIKRVDGGYVAYDGDEEEEEVTEIYAQSTVWCWEGIEMAHIWLNVDPGPPDPAFCGYTWAPPPAYGGGEADYHDERHLFYRVETSGDNLIIAMWPPEFNQYIEKRSYWNEENGQYRAIDYDNPAWDNVTDVGFPAGVGHICFPETISGVRIELDASERWWGNIWGNEPFTQVDMCISQYPYTSYQTKDFRWSLPLYSPVQYATGYDGVYVKNDWRTFFITGAAIYDDAGDWIFGHGATYYEREEVIEEERFVPETYPRQPLTERQLTIMQGNEGKYNYVKSVFTGLSSVTEGYWHTGLAMISINCGGEIYPIIRESYAGSFVYNYWSYEYFHTGSFVDYGIFTKEDVGVDENNEVDSSTIDPIYAYCLMMYDDKSGYGNKTVIYGMVKDGRHYRTEEYVTDGIWVTVPEMKGNPPWRCSTYVRGGVKKPSVIFKTK